MSCVPKVHKIPDQFEVFEHDYVLENCGTLSLHRGFICDFLLQRKQKRNLRFAFFFCCRRDYHFLFRRGASSFHALCARCFSCAFGFDDSSFAKDHAQKTGGRETQILLISSFGGMLNSLSNFLKKFEKRGCILRKVVI